MKTRFLLLVSISLIIASCGSKPDGKTGPLAAFDACSCATVQDMNSEDYKKCKGLREADAKFEADYQKCKFAANSGIKDTSKVNIQNAATATNLQPADKGNYSLDITTSKLTWYGEKVTGKKHSGSVNLRSGSLNIVDGKLSGEIVLDMNTLVNLDQSGEGRTKLETHLKSEDFFNVAKFPEAKYVITSATAKNAIQYDVVGNLTIKGITKEVKCNLVIAPNGSDVNIGGGLQFDRSLFDVRYGSDKFFDNLGNDMIRNEITLVIDLKGKKAVA
jgi:polyisoprenoid-binding protein YceI